MTRVRVGAIDLGAESGRVAVVGFDGHRLDLDIAHRFTHSPRERSGILRWDMATLNGQIAAGLVTLGASAEPIASVGVDCWGVDYGLVAADGSIVDEPTCYRDPRNLAAFDRARAAIGVERLYAETGTQVMPINTLFSLLSDVADHPDRLEAATTLLMLPDVFHHLLSGRLVTEYTAASTSACYDMASRSWATGLLDELGVPTRLLPEVVLPGTDVGALLGDHGPALRGTRVILPPAHDTASAVVATPLDSPRSMYISSGTWSLVGVERADPVINEVTRRANLTNEGGYDNTVRLLRNVMGLWILQECRRQWARDGHDLSYAAIAARAESEPGLVSIINPDATVFLGPGDMPSRIRAYCEAAGTPVPQSIGTVARCVIDSLALSYRGVRDNLTEVTGEAPPSVSIVGGGSSHGLLSQLTADATDRPVRCGPVEATALGNAATQLVALGELGGLDDIRRVVAATTELTEYLPRAELDWDSAAATLAELTARDADREREHAGVDP